MNPQKLIKTINTFFSGSKSYMIWSALGARAGLLWQSGEEMAITELALWLVGAGLANRAAIKKLKK